MPRTILIYSSPGRPSSPVVPCRRRPRHLARGAPADSGDDSVSGEQEGDDVWDPHVNGCGGGEVEKSLGFEEWKIENLLE